MGPASSDRGAEQLEATGVSVRFAGLNALTDVSVAVDRGSVIGLIGPNGAGKTTFINVMTGFQRPTQGQIRCDGRAIAAMSAHRLRRMGVARTFQSGRLFKELSVRENIEVAGVGLGMNRSQACAEATRVLEWIGITSLAESTAAALPYTDERRVAIGRALVGMPAYLLLDEPAAGMSEHEAADLADLIRRIAGELKCGVLLIEHNIGLVLQVCRWIYVLDSGEIIESGDAQTIRRSEHVRHAYMGTEIDLSVVEAELIEAQSV